MFQRRTFIALGLLVLATLGAAPATAQNCIGGVSIGDIQLPGGGLLGMVRGQLIIGHTGPTVFLFDGKLTELSPTPVGGRRGTIDGILVDASNTPQYQVRGRWFANALGKGFFRCVILTLGTTTPPKRVGRIGGAFPPTPGPLAFSPYEGAWILCQ